MGFYNNPFNLVNDLVNIPFGSDVYVISDEKYKELKQKQAADEIAVLERRLESYETAATKLRDTVTALKEEHGLLPPPSISNEMPN